MLFPKFIPCALLMGLVLCGHHTTYAGAQDGSVGPPPNILVIHREFVKPGMAGALHDTSESAFISAIRKHHSTARYIGVVSQSGLSRVLFLGGYPTLAAWEEENNAMGSDAALSADLEKATVADGALLTSYEQSVWRYRPDLSVKPGVNQGDRYMEIYQFNVRPGHRQEWEQMAAMIADGYKKGDPAGHWDIFQSVFGSAGNSYLVIIPLKNLGELDEAHANGGKFEGAMGPDGLKKLDQLSAEAVESMSINLFQFSPKMSYPPDRFIKADPEFWKTSAAGEEESHAGGSTR